METPWTKNSLAPHKSKSTPHAPGPKRFVYITFICVFGFVVLFSQLPKNAFFRLQSGDMSFLPTNPKFSRFFIKSKGPFQLCDTLEISIEARDEKNQPKIWGGDYFWIWLKTSNLKASAVADEIIDHDNGTYTARFQLHWSGKIDIAVILVHSSEEITILKRNRKNFPARGIYGGKFISNKVTEITPCHMTEKLYIPLSDTRVNRMFCNFTDEATGFPWYCIKPNNLSCNTYSAHSTGKGFGSYLWDVMATKKEMQLLTTGFKLISSATNSIVVSTKEKQTKSICTDELPKCYLGIIPRPKNQTTGFYYQDKWNSLVCKEGIGGSTQTTKCFQNKTLYFWGDSTLRQWYEYFVAVLPLKETKGTNVKFGPHIAVNDTNNITLHYQHHGYPMRNSWTLAKDIHYVPNLIDDISDKGDDIIILLTLWAHFTATSLDYYQNRWEAIKESILRLKARKPKTRVIIKSANTRDPTISDYSSWYAWELDKLMRKIMYGVSDVTIIDVWDMTIGHRTGFRIHPSSTVIWQEIGVLLSFICPTMA